LYIINISIFYYNIKKYQHHYQMSFS